MTETVTPITQAINPLLMGGRIPGVTFQLPSKGLFYHDGELAPDITDGELHVFPMTTLDEILIKTPDLLFNGEAVNQIFTRCIPNVLKPLRLLAKDVDFLLICLRSVSFGNSVTVMHMHTCDGAKEHKYNVSIQDFMNKTKGIDPTIFGNEYKLSMPDGKVCYLNPMRYDAVVHMMTSSLNDQDDISVDDIHTELVGQLCGLINRVFIPAQQQGNAEELHVTSTAHITEWISALPIPYMRLLQESIERMAEWGPDTSFDVKCEDCGESLTIIAPLNPMSFFI